MKIVIKNYKKAKKKKKILNKKTKIIKILSCQNSKKLN